MKHIEISGREVLISKGSSDISINDERLGEAIIKALPNNMEQFKDYVADIEIKINIYGADNNDLEVLKDYEEVAIND